MLAQSSDLRCGEPQLIAEVALREAMSNLDCQNDDDSMEKQMLDVACAKAQALISIAASLIVFNQHNNNS